MNAVENIGGRLSRLTTLPDGVKMVCVAFFPLLWLQRILQGRLFESPGGSNDSSNLSGGRAIGNAVMNQTSPAVSVTPPPPPTPAVPPRREYKKPPVLFDRTEGILAQLEQKLEAPLITYWNSPHGSICQNDVVGLYELLRNFGKRDLVYILIKSDGGDGQSSLRMVNLLRQHAQRVVALVPLEAASAATMLALGADEIRMGPMAYLTAVDTSFRHDLSPVNPENRRVSVSLDELSRVIKLWKTVGGQDNQNPYHALFSHVHPLVIGAVDRSSSLSIMLCREILSYHLSDAAKADQIAQTLNSNYPSHSYPITLRERRGLDCRYRS